jgi:hypothetical protein
MHFGIDDLLAAVVLSLIMLRRIEVKSARALSYPHVPAEIFESWRKTLLSAYALGATICAIKVVTSLLWPPLVLRFGLGQAWYSGVGLSVFVIWVITLVAVWRRVSDARTVQERLGIALRPPKPAP